MKQFLTIILVGMLAACHSPPVKKEGANVEGAAKIASAAYIYGYPLVTMEFMRRAMTNVAGPDGIKAPMGQFAHMRKYPKASVNHLQAPDTDTLFSTAWLDVSQEPFLVHIPEIHNRYYLISFLSGWTDVFASISPRTMGNVATTYALTGPHWNGQLPEGIKEIKSPTNLIWVVGRTACSGTGEDYKIVRSIQNAYLLTPLSAYQGIYIPPRGNVDPSLEMTGSIQEMVNALGVETYYNLMLQMMEDNPPSPADQMMLAEMAKIGLVPGKQFSLINYPSKIAEALQEAPKEAQKEIAGHSSRVSARANGWVYMTETGTYANDYLERAATAWHALGALLSQDVIHPYTTVDHEGKQLHGSHQYVIHFDKGEIPPVKGLWSLSAYNQYYRLVPNVLNRYNIGPLEMLKYNYDGSLDLYVQHTSPGPNKESNWLPVPNEPFVLMFRFYWPQDAIINGSWKPPHVTLEAL